jgi:hypothetical protein
MQPLPIHFNNSTVKHKFIVFTERVIMKTFRLKGEGVIASWKINAPKRASGFVLLTK